MRILFASESKGWSGGANQMLLTARELRRRGYKIIFALNKSGVISRRALDAGFKVRRLEIRQDYDVLSALRLKKICAEEGIDLVHAHHPQAHAVCLIARYLGLRAPLVVTRRVIFRIRVNPFSALKYRSARISRYVAVCNAAKTELVKGGVSAERVDVIPSAVEIDKYAGARQKRFALEFAPPFRVGMVGHYSWFKGHDIMLAAAPAILKEFPDTKFVFAGRDTDLLAEKAEAAGIAANVEILGERNDVPEILASLHIFAMPSLQEGIATALIEAQSAGVPAVASDVGGIPDVMLSGSTGVMVPKDDPAALADGILKMLKAPALSAQMAQNAYERVKSLFDIAIVAGRLEAMYKDVARSAK